MRRGFLVMNPLIGSKAVDGRGVEVGWLRRQMPGVVEGPQGWRASSPDFAPGRESVAAGVPTRGRNAAEDSRITIAAMWFNVRGF